MPMTICWGRLVRAKLVFLLFTVMVVACSDSGGEAGNEGGAPPADGAVDQGAGDAQGALLDGPVSPVDAIADGNTESASDAAHGGEASQDAGGMMGDGGLGAPIDAGVGAVVDATSVDGTAPIDSGLQGDAAPPIDGGASPDAASSDAANGSAEGEGGAYLCGSPVFVPPSDAGATTLLASVGLSRTNGLWKDGDRVAGQDAAGWVLWNAVTRLEVTQADTGHIAGMAGGVLLVVSGDGSALQTISEASGAAIGSMSLAGSSQTGLAIDGSYVWTASSSALTALSTIGTVLASQPEDYSTSIIEGSPGSVRVAMGPAGAQVIQAVPTNGAASTNSPPFTGIFANWFVDGTKFLTTLDNNVYVYAADVTQLEFLPVSTLGILGGDGQYLWNDQTKTIQGVVDVYAIGGSSEPIKTYSPGFEAVVVGSGHELALVATGQMFVADAPLPGAPMLTVADLEASPLTDTTVTLPFLNVGAFASDENGFWVVGTGAGAVLSNGTLSAPQQAGTLGCGGVSGMTGSQAGRVALGTAGAGVLILDLPSATASHIDLVSGNGPPNLDEFAPGPNNQGLALSSDGRTLAASASSLTTTADRSLYIFHGPAWTVAESFPHDDTNQDILELFSMSLNASTLAQTSGLFQNRWEYAISVTDITGSVPIFSESSASASVPLPSPDGTRSVVSDGQTTRFYAGATAIGAVGGTAAGWIDDNRVLIADTGFAIQPNPVTPGIYDAQGNLLATPALPFSAWNALSPGGTAGFDVIDSNRIFSHVDETIYDLTSGSALETFAGQGVVAGPFVVSVVGHALRATAY